MAGSNPLERKLRREMAARKEAEKLLEQKSLELYEANQHLHSALKHLEVKSEADLAKFEFEEYVDTVLIEFGRTFLSTSLSDILISRFLEKLLGSSVVAEVALSFDSDAFDTDKVPNIRRRQFGSASLLNMISQTLHPVWHNHILTLPILLENEWIGGWAFAIQPNEIDQNFIANQMSLMVDLVNSALTRQRLSERQIELRKRAEESERSTREFVAMINHELRTPLNGVLGSAELLDKTALTSEQHDYLSNLRHGGELLRVIINDLLDYSKMNAGLMEIVPKTFSWVTLESAMRGIFTAKAQDKGLHYRIERQGEIPKLLWADVERIKQILVNLLGNAFKFTHQGEVSLTSQWHNDRLTLTVQDSGIGIPQQAMATLFEPFIQVDRTTTRSYEGSGLGLAICHNLVELMDGRIECHSQIDVGTKFIVQIPAPCSDKQTQTHQLKSQEAKASQSVLKLLVVDDIRMNQIIVSQMLKKMGIAHDICSNGLEAIAAVNEGQYDLIFMDCRMPMMDGYTATESLRQDGFQPPIVALTAGTTLEERERCLECGMNDILTKPYTAQDIELMLGKWLY
ncbi:response regulator [Vibrio sp. SM6]|uniref:histidine kinase n=1 Tax=Vibrio agarilyticus TaxID=2726741 RepID=A0A7X8TPW4_9VIBR|nr:ATP-binding protein [Vibrio agarilyticus]NLS12636.1 response regulator [Vibrio agarilyticus]